MFDGIKIDCRGVNPLEWIDNDHLNFTGRFDIRTGEILRHPYEADHAGLKIKVIPSIINKSMYHGSINGSLHKHFNNGQHNANDFKLNDVNQVLNGLYQLLNITPDSVIRNLEFGVNIEIPIPAKEFIKKIISTPTGKGFDFKVHGKKVGKFFAPAKGQYELKIYDKAAAIKADPDQISPPPENQNLLRIEVKAKEMRFLKPYDISKLSDLQDIEKVRPLVNILLSMFNKLIINDIDQAKLTENQRIKVKDYINPLYWCDLHRKQREKELKRFRELTATAPALNIQATITAAIVEKWEGLLDSQQKRGDIYGDFSGVTSQPKKGTFTALEYRPYLSLLEGKKKQFLPTTKNDQKPPQKRYCKICGRDITAQRKNSLYCSSLIHGRKCRNMAGYQLRRERFRHQKAIEEKILIKICRPDQIRKVKDLIITDISGTITTAKPKELIFKPDQIRKITKVQFSGNSPPGIVTTMNAKKIIKYLINNNLKQLRQ